MGLPGAGRGETETNLPTAAAAVLVITYHVLVDEVSHKLGRRQTLLLEKKKKVPRLLNIFKEVCSNDGSQFAIV